MTTIRGELENLLLNVSKEPEVASHEAELDDNAANRPEGSRYLSAVSSKSEEAEDDETYQSAFERPRSVLDKDWRAYEVVNSTMNQFGERSMGVG